MSKCHLTRRDKLQEPQQALLICSHQKQWLRGFSFFFYYSFDVNISTNSAATLLNWIRDAWISPDIIISASLSDVSLILLKCLKHLYLCFRNIIIFPFMPHLKLFLLIHKHNAKITLHTQPWINCWLLSTEGKHFPFKSLSTWVIGSFDAMWPLANSGFQKTHVQLWSWICGTARRLRILLAL